MPGYGVVGPDEGAGLLPWDWAESRLAASRASWLATVGYDGRPHVSAVWTVWHDCALWFSCGGRTRKARHLRANGRCAMTSEDPHEPVVVEGIATSISDLVVLAPVLDLYAAKYGAPPPEVGENPVFAIRPTKVIALDDADLGGTATRWMF